MKHTAALRNNIPSNETHRISWYEELLHNTSHSVKDHLSAIRPRLDETYYLSGNIRTYTSTAQIKWRYSQTSMYYLQWSQSTATWSKTLRSFDIFVFPRIKWSADQKWKHEEAQNILTWDVVSFKEVNYYQTEVIPNGEVVARCCTFTRVVLLWAKHTLLYLVIHELYLEM